MIIHDDGGYGLLAAYRRLRLKPVGLVQRSAATWHRFCIHRVEPSELVQWLCYDNSTINIVVIIIIIIKCNPSTYTPINGHFPDKPAFKLPP